MRRVRSVVWLRGVRRLEGGVEGGGEGLIKLLLHFPERLQVNGQTENIKQEKGGAEFSVVFERPATRKK